MSEDLNSKAKIKIQKVFSYIRELHKIQTPPIGLLSSYEWSLRFSNLPSYPTIQKAQVLDLDGNDFDGVVLRVKRPVETLCPPPPKNIIEWIENDWDKLAGDARPIKARNIKGLSDQTTTEHFEDDQERVNSFSAWTLMRKEWQLAEMPVRESTKVFSDLFRLQAQLQRESEKFQLYLGDGHLVWASGVEPIDHPILLKKVELDFNSAVPEFVIRETDDSPELYTTLLRHHELEANAVLAAKLRLEETEPHPLANEKTAEYLKFFIQRFFHNGQFSACRAETTRGTPTIYRDPVIFLGNRSQGFAEVLDNLIQAIPSFDILPEALLRIVGVEEKSSLKEGVSLSSPSSSGFGASVQEQGIDFLLTKPANNEQKRVITRLEQTGSVLVQGPPGTGKSHTIANIIGHLLARGKTVLVSSHTSKALRVVREKVVKPLQPLCVSVLENDFESKSQLEESINGIVNYLSRTDSSLMFPGFSGHTVKRLSATLPHTRLDCKIQV